MDFCSASRLCRHSLHWCVTVKRLSAEKSSQRDQCAFSGAICGKKWNSSLDVQTGKHRDRFSRISWASISSAWDMAFVSGAGMCHQFQNNLGVGQPRAELFGSVNFIDIKFIYSNQLPMIKYLYPPQLISAFPASTTTNDLISRFWVDYRFFFVLAAFPGIGFATAYRK